MSNKTNDEKLRILRERLDQIKQKENGSSSNIDVEKQKVDTYTQPNSDDIKEYRRPFYSSWLSRIILILAIVYGCFYGYEKFNNSSLESSTETEEYTKSIIDTPIKYNLDLKGENIAITATFDDEGSAKAMANDLEIKGFKSGYFYLPNKSNSTQQVYKVFVGPYENEKEANQWIQHLDLDISIININDGSVSRNIKSKSRIQQEKIAKEKAEKEKIAKEKAEKEKIAKEKAEKEKIAKEKAEKEKIAKEKAEKEKIAKENAEKERLENESAKLKREINELKENKKKLLNNTSEVTIRYTYDFTNTTEDEGFITINNNAGYPQIKQLLSNIKSQGGIENILKNIKNIMNTNGIMIDDMFFEKDGTQVPTYKGDIKVVYY